jgi:hypothetical protein
MASLPASKQPARLEKIKIRLASMARFQLAFMVVGLTINYLVGAINLLAVDYYSRCFCRGI